MCVLNEEPGNTICLTADTKDDEIVSKRKSTCVCSLSTPATQTHMHVHLLAGSGGEM